VNPAPGTLDITVTPGEQGTQNEFTYTFDASSIDASTDTGELLVDFGDSSGIDTSDISQDDVTVTIDGSDESVDSVQEDNAQELQITLGSTFTLQQVNGDIDVAIANVSGANNGTFTGAFEVRDDSSVAVADGSADYTVNEPQTNVAIDSANFSDGNSQSDSVTILGAFTSTADEIVSSITVGFGNIAGNVGLGNVDAGNVAIDGVGNVEVGNVNVGNNGDDLEINLSNDIDLRNVDDGTDITITIDDVDTTEATDDGTVSVDFEDSEGNTIAGGNTTSGNITTTS
jgi:hypothetical protein